MMLLLQLPLLLASVHLPAAAPPAPDPAVVAAQVDDTVPPPVEDPLDLLGLRAEHPLVAATIRWAVPAGAAPGSTTLDGKGLSLRIDRGRVAVVRATVRGGAYEYRWGLPGGLERDLRPTALDASDEWTALPVSSVRSYRSPVGRVIGGVSTAGAELIANFHPGNGELVSVVGQADVPRYWASTVAAVQSALPVGKVDAATWELAIGLDLASDRGHVLAAWMGLGLGAAEATREGITLRVEGGRYVESLAFGPTFRGTLPYGLERPLRSAALSERFGFPDLVPRVGSRWTVPMLDSGPVWIDHWDGDGGPRLTVTLPPAVRRRWTGLLDATGVPAPELVESLDVFWDQVRENPTIFRGELLVGDPDTPRSLRVWRARRLLADVVAGTLIQEASVRGFERTLLRYTLRRTGSPADDGGASSLEPFRAAVQGIVGPEWACTTPEGETATSLTWEPVDEDLDDGPLLELRAVRRDDGPGFLVQATIIVPGA